jgi:hypothetical protein
LERYGELAVADDPLNLAPREYTTMSHDTCWSAATNPDYCNTVYLTVTSWAVLTGEVIVKCIESRAPSGVAWEVGPVPALHAALFDLGTGNEDLLTSALQLPRAYRRGKAVSRELKWREMWMGGVQGVE